MVYIFYSVWICNLILCWKLQFVYLELRSPIFSFWLVILTIFILPSFFDPWLKIIDGHPFAVSFQADIATLVIAQSIVFASLAFFYFLFVLFPIQRSQQLNFAESNSPSREMVWTLSLLAVSSLAFYEIISKFGTSFFVNFSFSDRREGLSFLTQFLLSYNFLAAVGLPFALFLLKQKLLAGLVFVYYVSIFSFLGGSRQPLIGIFLPFLAAYLFDAKHPKIKLAAIILASQIFLTVLAALLVVRYQASIEDKISLLMNPTELANLAGARSDDSAVRFAFYYFIETGFSYSEFGNLNYLWRTALFWLPSSIDIFDIKPVDFEYAMFSRYMNGEIGTMHPTFFGSIFADGLILFPIWILTVHLFFMIASKILNRTNDPIFRLMLWAVLCNASVMIARGSLYAPLVVFLFAVLYFRAGSLVTRRLKLS